MERRAFLKTAFGVAAGFAMLATAAQAGPLMRPPDPLTDPLKARPDAAAGPQPEPALATPDDLDAARLEQVRWGRRRRWGWRRRRFWGFRRRRRFWRRRRWRRRFYYY